MLSLPQQSQGLTTKLPQNQKQVFLELSRAVARGGEATLGRAWGAVFGYFFAGKKYQNKLCKSFN